VSDFVGVDVRGLKELQQKLSRAPGFIQDAVTEDVADYMIEVFRQQPPPRHVSRRAAYGRTFQSRRQQAWFFWALNAGIISVPYRRTQATRRGWKKVGSGRELIIANESEGAVWTMDDQKQARLNALVGWKKVGDHIRERSRQIVRRAEAALAKGLRKAGIR
jgi:hypothetical protein